MAMTAILRRLRLNAHVCIGGFCWDTTRMIPVQNPLENVETIMSTQQQHYICFHRESVRQDTSCTGGSSVWICFTV